MNCIKYIVAEYLKIYYKKNRILDVRATFTKELTDEQKKKLINKLSQKTGKEINLEIKIDKNISYYAFLKCILKINYILNMKIFKVFYISKQNF